MAIDLVIKSLLMPLGRIIFLLKLRGGTDLPQKPIKAGICTSREPAKNKWFFHGELPEEQEEPGDLEEIGEFQEFMFLESEPFIDPNPEYASMDDYLGKALERQEQEELGKMLPVRIP